MLSALEMFIVDAFQGNYNLIYQNDMENIDSGSVNRKNNFHFQTIYHHCLSFAETDTKGL